MYVMFMILQIRLRSLDKRGDQNLDGHTPDAYPLVASATLH